MRLSNLWIATFFPLTASFTAPQSSTSPNIVCVMVDDLGYGDLGVYDASSPIATPRLDAFATEGLRFETFYSGGVVCSPTRAALLTGRYPQSLNIRHVINGRSPHGIDGSHETLPELLRRAGYTSYHVGKWHLGKREFGASFGPIGVGFDKSFVAKGCLHYGHCFEVDEGQTGVATCQANPDGEHLTDAITRKAIEILDDHGSGPFFLNLWYLAPHVQPMSFTGCGDPYDAPDEFEQNYPDTPAGRYSALIEHLDDAFGRLLNELDARGLSQDTLVVFTSDNGPLAASQFGVTWSSGPLNGSKGEMFEGGSRVPTLVRWPTGVTPGVTGQVATTFDLYTTFAELAGVVPLAADLPGMSLVDTFGGGVTLRSRTLFFESDVWNSPRDVFEEDQDKFGVRHNDWKLVFEPRLDPARGPKKQLFNLRLDPNETVDLLATNPGTAGALESLYRSWRVARNQLDWSVEAVHGTVLQSSDGALFNFQGGAVELDDSWRYDLGDRDFSVTFLAHLRLPPSGQYTGESILIADPQSWSIFVDTSGRLNVRFFPGNYATDPVNHPIQTIRTGYQLSNDSWEKITVVFNGWITTDPTVTVFVDRVPLASNPKRTTIGVPKPNGVAVTPRPVFLGGVPSGANPGVINSPFRGRIRDLKVYAMALSPEEVADE